MDLPTVCTGWSVRDVLAHCGAAMTMLASGEVHRFTPADNQRDVEARRLWSVDAVLGELFAGYRSAAAAIDDAGGSLDGVGLGEWMHGGDVREALGVPDAYASAGSDLALRLLLERSENLGRPGADAHIDGEAQRFGAGVVTGSIEADLETFVRLCGGRRPDPGRYRLAGLDPSDLVLFS
jgi:uncharacterized protein (TIGR03083 family)